MSAVNQAILLAMPSAGYAYAQMLAIVGWAKITRRRSITFDFWSDGDRLVKSSKYIPKHLLSRVQELEGGKRQLYRVRLKTYHLGSRGQVVTERSRSGAGSRGKGAFALFAQMREL